MLIFTIILFEPSSSERWMPAWAVVISAVAFVFRSHTASRLAILPLAVLLAVTWLHNLSVYATVGASGQEDATVSRIQELQPVLGPHGIVSLLSFDDEISTFLMRFPFHPMSPLRQTGSMHFYFVAEPGNVKSVRWRQDFAKRALQTWQEDGDVWISKRMLAKRPAPAWGWVEGNDRYLKWVDISSFFGTYTFDGDIGGTDGFLRIARTQDNQLLLEGMAGKGTGVD
jgi:hypothetical protein